MCFQVVNGIIQLNLYVDEVITLTTVTTGNKGHHPAPPPAKEFPLPYMEDFESRNTYLWFGELLLIHIHSFMSSKQQCVGVYRKGDNRQQTF